MRKLLVVLAMAGLLALLLSIPAQAQMGSGLPFHVTLQGEKQGPIDGSCTMKGREKTILGWRFQYTVAIPTDAQTGLPSGKRRHQPVVITKDLDKSSPKLFRACVTGEHMKEVRMKFYRIDPKGKDEHYYTIILEDAVIQSIRQYPNRLDLNELSRKLDVEDISFTFKKIKMTWEIDGIESEDSWAVPLR